VIAEFVILTPAEALRGDARYHLEAPTADDDDEWIDAGYVDVLALTANTVGIEITTTPAFEKLLVEDREAPAAVEEEYIELAEAIWLQIQPVGCVRLAEAVRFAFIGASGTRELVGDPTGSTRPRPLSP
jgi:hypothetical protein